MPAQPPVVFDCDGVLLDTEEAWTRSETDLFARYGRTYGTAEKLALIGTSLAEAGARMEPMLGQPGRAEELLAELLELTEVEFSRGVRPMRGALELVNELRAAERPIAVASNSFRKLVDLALQGAGIADRFVAVLAGDEVASPKPAPDLYLEACRRLGVEPDTAVAIEDSPTGVASARDAGLYVIGVPYLPEIELPDADLVVESLEASEVRAVLGLA